MSVEVLEQQKVKKISVSVIVPVYNVDKYLSQCLESISKQTLKDIEIICIDDGSTDYSLNILEEFASNDSRFVIIKQENKGSSAARNAGLKIAKGEYIGFVDSDDWIDLDFYRLLYNKARVKNADIARTNYKKHSGKKVMPEMGLFKKIRKKALKGKDLDINDHSTVIWNAIYRTSFLREHNIGFDESLFCCVDVLFTAMTTFLSKKSVPVIGAYYNYRETRDGQISAITDCKVQNIVDSNFLVLNFINSIDIKRKRDYLIAFQRCIWRFDYIFKLALELDEFDEKKQVEYVIKFIEFFHQCKYPILFRLKYSEPYFKFLIKKNIEGYIQSIPKKKMNKDFYNSEFYNIHAQKSYNSAKITLDILSKYIKPKSVLDVGCGVGTWLKAWQELGVEQIQGLDANEIADSGLFVPRENIQIVDLESYKFTGKKYDLAMSLECAEHIKEEFSGSFIDILTQSSDAVMFSAAIPHQSGTNHINCKPLSFWVELFSKRGFECFDILRPELLQHNDDVDCWYIQNILFFARGQIKDDLILSGCKPVKNPVMFYHEHFANKIFNTLKNNQEKK